MAITPINGNLSAHTTLVAGTYEISVVCQLGAYNLIFDCAAGNIYIKGVGAVGFLANGTGNITHINCTSTRKVIFTSANDDTRGEVTGSSTGSPSMGDVTRGWLVTSSTTNTTFQLSWSEFYYCTSDTVVVGISTSITNNNLDVDWQNIKFRYCTLSGSGAHNAIFGSRADSGSINSYTINNIDINNTCALDNTTWHWGIVLLTTVSGSILSNIRIDLPSSSHNGGCGGVFTINTGNVTIFNAEVSGKFILGGSNVVGCVAIYGNSEAILNNCVVENLGSGASHGVSVYKGGGTCNVTCNDCIAVNCDGTNAYGFWQNEINNTRLNNCGYYACSLRTNFSIDVNEIPRVSYNVVNQSGETQTIDFNPPITSRVIRITTTAAEYLNIAELQIWSDEVNVAIGKSASQKTTMGSYLASNAVDDNVNTFTHSEYAAIGEWLEVDLGTDYVIDQIVVIKRASYGSRPQNYKIEYGPRPVAAQSSTYDPYVASLSIDNDTNTFQSTASDAVGAWLKVDLGATYDVARIEVVKRTGYADRPKNYEIVMDSVVKYTAVEETDATHVIQFDPIISAREVMIRTTASEFINVSEFKVLDSSGINLSTSQVPQENPQFGNLPSWVTIREDLCPFVNGSAVLNPIYHKAGSKTFSEADVDPEIYSATGEKFTDSDNLTPGVMYALEWGSRGTRVTVVVIG